MPTSTHRDPRSVITPDAFEISTDLVGRPLALPRTRAVALAIDGVVIAFVTFVTKSFALILGLIVAVLLVRAGLRRTKVRGSVFGRAMSLSVGCLGAFVFIITVVVWASAGFDFAGGTDDDEIRTATSVTDAARLVGGALASAGVLESVTTAGSVAQAERAASDFIEAGRALGMTSDDLRSALSAAVPDTLSWSDEWAERLDALLPVDEAEAREPPPTSAVASEIEAYSDEEALIAYAALMRAAADDPGGATDDSAGRSRRQALETRLLDVVAADTLRTLARSVQRLRNDLDDRDTELARTQARLDEATGGGLFQWVRDRLDDLGFGFGWAAVYMTVVLSWWNGQTVGKRVMGIRVVRLDGEPITWWIAFERVGGYAAGFATGLLGFAQVWWDANRQGIHDRIVGTVVVIEGAERVKDWEAAL